MMLHTKYQDYRPCGFRQEDFFMFPYISLCKKCDPGAGHFWPQGYNLNKLGRDPLGDSRLQAIWFQTGRFLKFSSRKSIFSLCDLDMQRARTI